MPHPSAAQYDALLRAIYAAADPGGDWAPAMQRASAALGATQCSLQLLNAAANGPPRMLAAPGVTAEEAALHVAHYRKVAPFSGLGLALANDRVIVGDNAIDVETCRRSQYWNDFAARHGQGFHMMGASISLDDGRFALIGMLRPEGCGQFDAAETGLLGRLVPHLRQAIDLRLRLDAAVTGSADAALQAGALGAAAVLHPDGQLHVAPPAFTGAAARLGLSLAGRRVTLPDARAAARFTALLGRLAEGGAGGALEITPADAAERSFLELRRLPGEAPLLLLTLRLPRPAAERRAMLREAFTLSSAEADVALGMLEGASAEQIAERRGTALSTVRTQWGRVLLKAQAANTRELALLAGRMLGG
ncbi:MAG: hypothetical protein NTW56_03415 [Alphaproteobacteria bacterium]|nr:hypothetical protein [Alphaproteobacteria bacterium]